MEALNKKSEFYVYVQIKSNQIPESLKEQNSGEARNKYLILTEKEFKDKIEFFDFINDDLLLLKQMKSECDGIKNDHEKIGTYNACKYLNSDIAQKKLYNEIENHLKVAKEADG